MAATKQDISGWFDNGKSKGASHLLVVCDTFDYDDYPIYVENPVDFWVKYRLYDKATNMSKVMEVYDLNLAKDVQLNERRVWNVPSQEETKQ